MSTTTPATTLLVGYVDGFVIPIPTANLDAYRAQAQTAAEVWLEYGALNYLEAVGDDLASENGVPFPQLAQAKEGETVVFSWISYQNKAHRDEVNAKVMADPRIKAMCPLQNPDVVPPFDPARMTYGGFKTLVQG